MVGTDGPITAREIMDRTGIADGTLYPILEKRVAAGIIVEVEGGHPARFDLSPDGYEVAKAILLSLELSSSAWLRCDRRHRPPLLS